MSHAARRWIPYRMLTSRAQTLRRDPTPAYDEARTAALELQGIRVLQFTNPDVLQNFDSVCANILAAIEEVPKT